MSGSSSVGTTAVPAPSFTDAGFVAPAESDILTGELADLNAAFGGNLNPALSTPQGQLATSFTAALGDAYAQILAVLNGVDPARAFGRLQDAIGYLYFMTRKGATATVVTVDCVGAANAVIPSGSLIQDAAGYKYAADGAIALDANGSGAGEFTCTTTGPIACAANSVSVYQTVPGLTSVSNPAAGVTGRAEETRVEFEQRRVASVAANATGSVGSIAGAVSAVDGVTSYYVVDNPTGAPVTQGGVTIAAHSVYVCVVGGADDDVATAIVTKKPAGCGYTGTTTVTIPVPNTGLSDPPTTDVSFTRAADTSVYFAISIKQNASLPADYAAQVQAAVMAEFAADANVTIGGTVMANAYYAPVVSLGAWAKVLEIACGTAASPATFAASVDIDQIPTLDASNVTVTAY